MNSKRFVRRLDATWILLALSGSAAWAGPNAHGTLIVHANPAAISSSCFDRSGGISCALEDSCIALDACEHAITSAESGVPQTWTVLAAFSAASSPRMTAVTFAVQYTPGITLTEFGACADFELAQGGWPGSGSGTALSWSTVQTDQLKVLYWFKGYVDASPQLFSLVAHPEQGAYFADDSVPAVLDQISGLGSLGFGQAGTLVCPTDDPTLGACCRDDGSCVRLLEAECGALGGTFRGEGTTCESVECIQHLGACCLTSGSCSVVLRSICDALGGEYQGDGVPCVPSPCSPPPGEGACCLPNGVCVIGTEQYCATQSGDWKGEGMPCEPSPCEPSGACCVHNGVCRVLTESWCATYFGAWFGANSDCNVVDCPPQQIGACCTIPSGCSMLYADDCVNYGGSFQGEGVPCSPNPCPPAGACCLPDRCEVTYQPRCESFGGSWLGEGSTCTPYPCPGPAGACCIDGACVFILPPDCFAGGGYFLGPNFPCYEGLCGGGGVPQGACCTPIECIVLTPDDCAAQGGVYLGDGVPCDPPPCAPVAIDRKSWGAIKARYR